MGIDRKKNPEQANHVAKVVQDLCPPEDRKKIAMAVEAITGLPACADKGISLRRLKSVYIEFKEDGLMFKVDRHAEGSINIAFNPDKKEEVKTDAVQDHKTGG